MPQTITITKTLYTFDELDDAAKEKARDWFRERLLESYDFECVIDDFVTVAEIIGVNFKQRTRWVKPDGSTVYEASIYWSGFCSQGDGACFEGRYDYKATAPAKIREHAPEDKELHRIADELSAIQLRNRFGLHAHIYRDSTHYCHENTVGINVHDRRDEDRTVEDAEAVRELMRDLMRWLYRQLNDQNDYLYSAEYVDEMIEINDYTFDEEGNRDD